MASGNVEKASQDDVIDLLPELHQRNYLTKNPGHRIAINPHTGWERKMPISECGTPGNRRCHKFTLSARYSTRDDSPAIGENPVRAGIYGSHNHTNDIRRDQPAVHCRTSCGCERKRHMNWCSICGQRFASIVFESNAIGNMRRIHDDHYELKQAVYELRDALAQCKVAVENKEMPPSGRLEMVRDISAPVLAKWKDIA